MNTTKPVLRFRLHQAAVDAVKSAPPPPVALTKQTRREWRAELKRHYHNALCNALDPSLVAPPNNYQCKIWRGILSRLQGRPSRVPPIYSKQNVMPCMREWAEKRGLI